jgi:hypothetical protein
VTRRRRGKSPKIENENERKPVSASVNENGRESVNGSATASVTDLNVWMIVSVGMIAIVGMCVVSLTSHHMTVVSTKNGTDRVK